MTISIQSLIDKALIRPERERSGKFNPSSFGGCYRKQYWNRKNEPKSNPPDERQIRVFAAGQLFHDFVQNLMPNCKKEVLVESDDVKGFADLVSDTEVIDIKSQHSKSFWYMAKFKGDDIKKEKYSNWLQVLYYARELGKKFGRLVFVSKDDLAIQEYVQPLDDYWLGQIDAELKALRYLWKKDELPPAKPRCKPNKKGEYWECNYCDWKDKCFEMERDTPITYGEHLEDDVK
jgi:hypothetical protein